MTAIISAIHLKKGDKVLSASGNVLTVSNTPEQTANRVIVLLDGDMEIDFKPYDTVRVVT